MRMLFAMVALSACSAKMAQVEVVKSHAVTPRGELVDFAMERVSKPAPVATR